MVTTKDPEPAQKILLLGSHGMTPLTWDRNKGYAWSHDVIGPGYNYRIDEIRAALGSAQLKKLARNNPKRRSPTQEYRRQIGHSLTVAILPFKDHAG